VFQALKQNNYQERLLYWEKSSFKIKGEIKVFHDKHKLNKFTITKPALQKILKGILHTKEEERYVQS
jgi:hypothetical protein